MAEAPELSRHDLYLRQFSFCDEQIKAQPEPDLAIVVVIPCFNEPDLVASLNSLWTCVRPRCAVEVIVVINSAANSPPEAKRQNQLTLEEAARWKSTHYDRRLTFHLLDFQSLPPKHAGVGLARKIGMDEAVRRFSRAGHPNGLIACFDADCECDRNYFTALERHFEEHPGAPGASIYFEHPLGGPLEPRIYEAVAAYELHLRFYVQGLRYAGFPYAFHTVGSSMAVRAGAYQKQGGMNKRQAGEDFYFLHKIIPLGDFAELNETRVIPSPRASDRVPFGTGKAISGYLREGRIATYPIRAFHDLKKFFEALPSFSNLDSGDVDHTLAHLSPALAEYLQLHNFKEALREIRENTASAESFRKRFFHWFNGFMAMKFIHHARDRFYGEGNLTEEPDALLEHLERAHGTPRPGSVQELLKIYRELDRRGSFSPIGTG